MVHCRVKEKVDAMARDLETGNAGRPAISAAARQCVQWLREYASTRINSRLIDERRCIPAHIVLDFGNHGLLAMQVPRSWGGKLELSCFDTLQVLRQVAAIDLTLAVFVGLSNLLGVRPVWKFGKPAIQQRYLPDLSAGRVLAALALTEPSAGSNPLEIKATARATADGAFVLNGTKIWSGNAAWAGLIHVVANQVSADGKSLGHAAFCVPTDLKGVRQGPEALTSGLRGMVENEVLLENAAIAPEFMLGEPGGGLAVAGCLPLPVRKKPQRDAVAAGLGAPAHDVDH